MHKKKRANSLLVTGLHVIGQFIVQNYKGLYYTGNQTPPLHSHIQG